MANEKSDAASAGRGYWQHLIWHHTSGTSLWRTLVPRRFDISVAGIVEGLRAGVACAVPVFIAEASHNPDLSWAAIAAFWICLADPGGAMQTRFTALSILAILGALSCAVAIWATALSIWLAVSLGFLWSLAGSLARIYGEAPAKVGQFVLVAFLVAIGNFDGRSIEPVAGALLYLAGASWALILTLVLWRIHPHGPSRRALAAVYDALAGFATALAQLRRTTKLDGDPWGAMARDHRRRIREALDFARATVARIGRTRQGRSRRADQQLALLEDADQIFAALIALSDLLERDQGRARGPAFDPSLANGLDRLPALLETLSAAILAGDKSLAPPLDAKLRDISRAATEAGSIEGPNSADRSSRFALHRHVIETVYLYISSAAAAAAGSMQRTSLGSVLEPLPDKRGNLREELLAPLFQNLTAKSVPLQHALRLAVAASIALLITFEFELGHGYWLTMTTVLILQPYAATTWQLSLKRMVGSVLGGVLAAALGIVFHTPLAIALVTFPITIATMIFRTVDYGLYVLFLTPQFVLISALAEPGTGDLGLSWLRAVNSVLGGFLALAAGTLLWPGRELRHLPTELAKAISANRDYASRILAAQPQSRAVDAARRLAGLASNNAEASVQRLLSEPAGDPIMLEAAITTVTSLRRVAGAMTMIWLLRKRSAISRDNSAFRLFAEWIGDALQSMADAAGAKTAPAALEEKLAVPQTAVPHGDHAEIALAEAIAQICNQLEIIHAALTRLAGSKTTTPPAEAKRHSDGVASA